MLTTPVTWLWLKWLLLMKLLPTRWRLMALSHQPPPLPRVPLPRLLLLLSLLTRLLAKLPTLPLPPLLLRHHALACVAAPLLWLHVRRFSEHATSGA